ncbi:MAG: hypothetical protein U0354_09510 [Candidatus Sericytochromatia bacterium]
MVLSLLLGMINLSANFIDLPLFFTVTTPIYFHFYMIGWITQLIFGVAWWMFPVITIENPKGSDNQAWLLYILINTGLILRSIAEPFNALESDKIWAVLLVLSAIIQFFSGVLYSFILWKRVKPKKVKEKLK